MTKEQKTALIVATSTAFITAFSGSALNLAIPEMSVFFHMGAASVGWITTAYMIVIASMSVPFGKLADNTSRRNILLAGTIVFVVSSFAAVFSVRAFMIILARGIQGVGASMIFATNMPIAMSRFPGNERGKVIGTVTTGTYAGLALGPVLGGLLTSAFGWKGVFLFAGVVGAAAIAITLAGLKKQPHEAHAVKTDVKGTIVYVIMIAAFIYGLTVLNSMKFGWVFLVAAVLLGIIFVKIELSTDEPVIDVRIFAQDSVFTLSNLTALFNYSATFALGYMGSIYLQVAHGLPAREAGFVLIAQPFFMALLSRKMGKLSDRIAPYKLASGGMAICSLALLFFAFVKADTPIWAVVTALSAAGIGISLFSSPNTNVIMSRVHPSKFGVTNSIVSTMRTTGQSSGMAVITLVVAGTVGNISLYDVPADELIRTMHIAFFIFTGLCILGIFMSLQRKRVS